MLKFLVEKSEHSGTKENRVLLGQLVFDILLNQSSEGWHYVEVRLRRARC